MGKKKRDKSGITGQKKITTVKDLFRGIWGIIINKQDKEREFTKETLVTLMSCFLNVCSLFLLLFFIFGIYSIICRIGNISWNLSTAFFGNILAVVLMLFLCAGSGLFAIILKGSANEIEHEEDKNYIIALFSGIVGFSALIVSCMALVKG